MSAVSSKRCADLTIKTLKELRNESAYDAFYKNAIEKAENLEIKLPQLSRKRKKPKMRTKKSINHLKLL